MPFILVPAIYGFATLGKIKHQDVVAGAFLILRILGESGRKSLDGSFQVHIQCAVLGVPIGIILFGIHAGFPNLRNQLLRGNYLGVPGGVDLPGVFVLLSASAYPENMRVQVVPEELHVFLSVRDLTGSRISCTRAGRSPAGPSSHSH